MKIPQHYMGRKTVRVIGGMRNEIVLTGGKLQVELVQGTDNLVSERLHVFCNLGVFSVKLFTHRAQSKAMSCRTQATFSLHPS